MKSALTALCMLALIPVATSASEIPAAEETIQARCLQNAAAAKFDSRVPSLVSQMHNRVAQPMGAVGASSGGSVSRNSWGDFSAPMTWMSACLRQEKRLAAAQRTSEPRRLWKAGPR
jgi:hypothetical protein